MPMWLLKKDKQKKEEKEAAGKNIKRGSKDSSGGSEDDRMEDISSGKKGDPASPVPRRKSLGGDPASPGPSPPAARPRRMSFDASANADLVKNALGDVNNIIAKAAEQQKEGARPRRASFSGALPGQPGGPTK